jgi:hypothetical protein
MDKEKLNQPYDDNDIEETAEEIEARRKLTQDTSCCSDVDFDDDDKEFEEDVKEQAKRRSNYGNYKQKHSNAYEKTHQTGEKVGEWLKESYEKGKEEVLRLTKIAKIKLDIAALRKKRDERLKLLGKKAIELVKSGHIDVDLIEPEYSMIKEVEAQIADRNLDVADVSKRPSTQPQQHTKQKDDKPKAITAQSIPLDDKDEEDTYK